MSTDGLRLEPAGSLVGSGAPVVRMAWHPTEPLLAVARADGEVVTWGLEGEGQVLLDAATLALAWAPDGSWLFVAPAAEAAFRLDVASGESIPLPGELGRIWCAAVSPDGQRIAAGCGDDSILVWRGGELETVLRGHGEPVVSLAWGERGLASGSHDGTVAAWTGEALEAAGRHEAHKLPVGGVCWSRGAVISCSAGADRRVLRWTGPELHRLFVADGEPCGVTAFGGIVACSTANLAAELFDLDVGEVVAQLPATDPVRNLWQGPAFHPRLGLLASLDVSDRIVRAWRL